MCVLVSMHSKYTKSGYTLKYVDVGYIKVVSSLSIVLSLYTHQFRYHMTLLLLLLLLLLSIYWLKLEIESNLHMFISLCSHKTTLRPQKELIRCNKMGVYDEYMTYWRWCRLCMCLLSSTQLPHIICITNNAIFKSGTFRVKRHDKYNDIHRICFEGQCWGVSFNLSMFFDLYLHIRVLIRVLCNI